MKKPKPFATEVELCAAFLSALPKGWTAYAETAGFDLLLVRDVDGFQIGIEAKLKCNATVLQQSLEDHGRYSVASPGPDCRAILVPDGEGTLKPLADYLGITVIQMRMPCGWSGPAFLPGLPTDDQVWADYWHEWLPAKRCPLPAYVPDVPAGAPAPVQLTDWKIKALKLVILAEVRGHVTRADFKFLGLDHRRWITPDGWLRATDRRGWYVAHGSPPTALKKQHPRVYEQIKADAETWMPKVGV